MDYFDIVVTVDGVVDFSGISTYSGEYVDETIDWLEYLLDLLSDMKDGSVDPETVQISYILHPHTLDVEHCACDQFAGAISEQTGTELVRDYAHIKEQSTKDLNRWKYEKDIQEYGEAFKLFVENMGGFESWVEYETAEQFKEYYYGHWNSVTEYVEHFFESTYMFPGDFPSDLYRAIDWHSIGQGWLNGGVYWTAETKNDKGAYTGVHIFRNL